MKKYIFLAFVMVIVSVGLLQAQNRETRKVENFTKLSLRVPGTVHLKQGTPQSVEISAPADALKEIETNVEGSKLVIERDGKWYDWDDDNKIEIWITMPTIEAIAVAGSGSVEGETKITAQALSLNVSGSGNLKLDVDVTTDIESSVSGSGAIDLKGSCKAFDGDISGSGRVDMDLKAIHSTDFSVSGSGKFEVSGSTSTVKASVSGSGKVLAAELEAERCEIKISGSGHVEVNAKNEIDANISGSGSVGYKGSPSKVNSHSSGSGKVSKL